MKIDIYLVAQQCNHILCTKPVKFMVLKDDKLFALVCPEHLEVWALQAKRRS
ncbi:hypothetical protein LCGC14_2902720 [marine sediment metagenome]|uniref:Uncharacterized protein n=1 Tax=marine sediment metagenome TaxID=412755 RepID=A0A0F8YFU1_9ZZZZ